MSVTRYLTFPSLLIYGGTIGLFKKIFGSGNDIYKEEEEKVEELSINELLKELDREDMKHLKPELIMNAVKKGITTEPSHVKTAFDYHFIKGDYIYAIEVIPKMPIPERRKAMALEIINNKDNLRKVGTLKKAELAKEYVSRELANTFYDQYIEESLDYIKREREVRGGYGRDTTETREMIIKTALEKGDIDTLIKTYYTMFDISRVPEKVDFIKSPEVLKGYNFNIDEILTKAFAYTKNEKHLEGILKLSISAKRTDIFDEGIRIIENIQYYDGIAARYCHVMAEKIPEGSKERKKYAEWSIGIYTKHKNNKDAAKVCREVLGDERRARVFEQINSILS